MKSPFFKSSFVLALMFIASLATVAEVSGYGSSGGSGTRVKNRVTTPAPQVLGESTTAVSDDVNTPATKYIFLIDLRLGMSSQEVTELQKRLRAEGFFTFPTNTGYFGTITLEAVKAYQTAHPEIGYVTGFFGPLTRGVMNK